MCVSASVCRCVCTLRGAATFCLVVVALVVVVAGFGCACCYKLLAACVGHVRDTSESNHPLPSYSPSLLHHLVQPPTRGGFTVIDFALLLLLLWLWLQWMRLLRATLNVWALPFVIAPRGWAREVEKRRWGGGGERQLRVFAVVELTWSRARVDNISKLISTDVVELMCCCCWHWGAARYFTTTNALKAPRPRSWAHTHTPTQRPQKCQTARHLKTTTAVGAAISRAI